MDPLAIVIALGVGASVFCWIASLITRDYSWVDRLWSIMPVVYVWVFAIATPSTAGLVLAILVTAWGVRLTANFARKGGYTGVEDYRWAILRERMTPAQYEIFNIVFICLIQNAIILGITLPAAEVARAASTSGGFGIGLAILTVAFVLVLIGETVADQQQWKFHQAKHADGYRGPRFAQTGLWRLSRHPNYFFEITTWWIVYAFGAVAAGAVLNWTIAGVVALTALFIGSTKFTESITLSRYPEYRDYQATTSMLVPWPPRRSREGRTSPA